MPDRPAFQQGQARHGMSKFYHKKAHHIHLTIVPRCMKYFALCLNKVYYVLVWMPLLLFTIYPQIYRRKTVFCKPAFKINYNYIGKICKINFDIMTFYKKPCSIKTKRDYLKGN